MNSKTAIRYYPDLCLSLKCMLKSDLYIHKKLYK